MTWFTLWSLKVNRVLYSGNRNASSWAFRAWLSLKEQKIDFKEIIIDIRRPQRWKNLSAIGKFSPPAAVPVLVDEKVTIFDSLAIMEYANELGDGTLLPSDIKRRAQVRSFVAWQHSNFGSVCPCLSFESTFYKEKKALSENEINNTEWVYTIWEKYLKKTSGPYLLGNYSLADIALLPSVLRLTAHHPVPKKFHYVASWSKKLINRPFVQEWLTDAYLLEPIYCEGYYNS